MSPHAPPMTALRRAAKPVPSLHGPARTFDAPDPTAGDWNQELPGTGIELILELDGAWELEIGGRPKTVQSFAAGLVAAPVRSRPRGRTRLVQLALDPLAIPPLFGVPAGELQRTAVDLDALLGARSTRNLLESLDSIDDSAARATAADAWASRRIADAPARDAPPDVTRAVALLRASGGRLEIGHLAVELGCSRRHLARRFATWLGVTPSEYRRLVRFEGATQALRAQPAQPLGLLAVATGYADHAHMDRDFGALAGRPPRAVAAALTS